MLNSNRVVKQNIKRDIMKCLFKKIFIHSKCNKRMNKLKMVLDMK
jgi:hypothetical protein